MEREYNHPEIEKKWQKIWNKKKAYKSKNNSKKKKCYVLDMFPYPSGKGLHVGHPKGYIGSDVYARKKRQEGFNVLHPMGYDAFGLPAEQYALEHHIHPRKAVEENVKTFEGQLNKIGLSFDWDRRVNTTDPAYYKWTQWIFLKIYKSWFNKDTNKAEPISNLIKRFEKEGNLKVNAFSDNVSLFSAEEWKKKTEKEKQDVLMSYRLAYEGYSEVNWCPVLGTVLANDEIVDGPNGPVSERGGYPVVKKSMRQWFMRITAYADRLLSGLEDLDWSTHIKEIQKNWIGKSEGSEIGFELSNEEFRYSVGEVKVFTTRADTLYGVTYVVLAPEHSLVKKLLEKEIKNKDEVENYIEKSKIKSLEDRLEAKEKTGVRLEGIVAIHPITGERISVWISDYVLLSYGTGAVMAVPAHDERDYEFAQKYRLPIKEVVIPVVVDKHDPPKPGVKTVERKAIQAIVVNPKNNKVLALRWKKLPWTTFITGGIEGSEDVISAARREILEETGYKNVKYVKTLGSPVESHFFANHKNENRKAFFTAVVFEIINEERKDISEEEKEIHEPVWLTWGEIDNDKNTKCAEYDIWKDRFFNNPHAFTEHGTLINSGRFNEMRSEEAKIKITKEVKGKIVTKYKMRDAIFARQRYWGEPIPLEHDKNGIIKELSEKSLPLKLPEVKSYMPTGTGESPLAGVSSWVKRGLETNTMPGWAGSSWYFLRYMDPKNKKVFADKKSVKYWKDVDMYVGGQEHATGHLLYSRFWHKVLKDYDLVDAEEPFKTLKNQGLILGIDNRKMSKRWGNVVNPDDIVKSYGADTLRVYEMFMGPFEASLPWNTDSIIGSRRFLDRVWKLSNIVSRKTKPDIKLQNLLHKTIKKVSSDIDNFAFNTAISSMMILLNEMDKRESVIQKDFELFLKILSPFAPHMTEEIWQSLGHKSLIVLEKWPKADSRKMKDLEVKIVVQINSKVRAEMVIDSTMKEDEVVKEAKELPDISKWLIGKEVRKVIYIKNRLLNLVVF